MPADAARHIWSRERAQGGRDLHWEMAGTAEAVRETLQAVLKSCDQGGLSKDLQGDAEIVLAEVLNNIVEHAYARHAGTISLSVDQTAAGLECRIVDHGAPMPGLCLPEGAFQVLDATEDLPEGGFGWFLIRSLTEGLHYHRQGDSNCLSFRLIGDQSRD